MGLIGSSIGHALKRGDLAAHITGYARSAETRQKALNIGFVDSIADSLKGAVADADIVFERTRGDDGEIVRDMAPSLKPGAILTDVGSVKKSVMDAVHEHLTENTTFVPAHPIAGTELGLRLVLPVFDNRWCILTPDLKRINKLCRPFRIYGVPWGRMWKSWMPITMTLCWRLPAMCRI